ncbi:prolyl 3-hydroxylase 1 isoform X3 [Canis lupus familiaris]|uniref:prolyl 3-hydroxylase 1 isoform X3 n=2 Tax=Canis lupus TaxID=9612 RepID=UPI0018F2CA3E|nr:prolyl 3-hydroxylase 1 isoform X3 [Canis lupus familiaris]
MEMQQNLDYYQTMSGVKEADFKDLEAKPHMHEFRLGVRLYSEEQPHEAVAHLEAALREYVVADTECRALCEGPYDYDGYNYLEYNADLFQAIADHYIQVLSCKQNCVTELASHPSREKPFEDFLPSHYNYLQFAYYNIGNYTQAIECAKTYLLFFPNDEVMNQNLAYYTAMVGEEPARFISPRECHLKHVAYPVCTLVSSSVQRGARCQPQRWLETPGSPNTWVSCLPVERLRKSGGNSPLLRNISTSSSAQEYRQRSLLEKELLFFAYDVFGIPFVDPDSWTPEEVIPKRLQEKQKSERETAVRISQEIGNLMKEIETLVEEKTKESLDVSRLTREGGPLLYEGINLTMNSRVLNGSQRVVMDGVISPEECRELQRLTNAAATSGDGYRGQTSPHTPSEKFYGVTVFKALKLGQEGRVPLQSAHLYYNVTEKVRRVMESYFRLDTPLYFSYSHLVCRTAIEEAQAERKDSSHPVHVDNCILNAEALVCIKEPPAYTFRDYSAILYLNGDFDGGTFYFTELDAKTVTAEVQPQCGRAVGFSSGTENPHGVKAVTRGQRCAIALWFTLDARHSERDRVQADDLVRMLFSPEEVDLSQEQPQDTQEGPPQPVEESLSGSEVGRKDEL